VSDETYRLPDYDSPVPYRVGAGEIEITSGSSRKGEVSDVQSILKEFTRLERPHGNVTGPLPYYLDEQALAAALLDARTEAVALRATEENLRAQLERMRKVVATADFREFDTVVSDDQCEQVLADLDAYAIRQGAQYGLPDSESDNAAMHAIIRAALAKEP
jgi:hypothetical protein